MSSIAALLKVNARALNGRVPHSPRRLLITDSSNVANMMISKITRSLRGISVLLPCGWAWV